MNLWDTIKEYISDQRENAVLVSEVPQFAEARCAVENYLQETRPHSYWNIKVQDLEAGKTLLSAEPQLQIAALLAALTISVSARRRSDYTGFFCLRPLISALMRRSLPYTDEDRVRLAQAAPGADERAQLAIVRILTEHAEHGNGPSAPLRAALETWREDTDETGADATKLRLQIQNLLVGVKRAPLLAGEPWGDAVMADLEAMATLERDKWSALLSHAIACEAAKPSSKWLKLTAGQMEAIGRDTFVERFQAWAALFTKHHFSPGAEIYDSQDSYTAWLRMTGLRTHNYAVLKGLVWCCRLIEGEAMAALLGDLADHSLRKIPSHGPKSAKVGNACISSLGAMSGLEPVAQLSRLKRKVKYAASQGIIEAALAEAAKRAGLPPEDLEELATPTFGLDENGRRREEIGEYFAELAVTAGGHAELTWSAKDGKALKSVPAELKKNHAEALKELKTAEEEMGKTIPGLRTRLENLLLTDRSWTLADWRERYLDHPLMGTLTRRLIWRFTDGNRSRLGVWSAGSLTDETGAPIDGLSAGASVRLWHPLGDDAETVLAWRQRLEAQEIRQPFKQAHREIYLLTDAEIATETYSNRFAAHILRQHQFQALCRERGWRYQLQGGFDGANTPTLTKHGLCAEFWVDASHDHELSGAGISLYISTDQVRFHDDQGRPLRLADVPPLLFSEIMRDVDLFVGVCSIGNDPNWRNNGGFQAHDGYWRDFSFGELTATAQTRRDVLSRLLPRLKIAGQCTLEGKFLHVRGSMRTYKIHLGSGNILMEPNDQYLCIVPDRRKDAKADGGAVFLPFEGDQLLAVILSKAFLLADDGAIKDKSIVSQIRR